ncbi:hypothetical protein ACFCYC_14135 [Streptomyces sp. NPDC056402]|uniref:hypothetical protein n=1 Tax=Streptomyces sp. NPDC056402 TaxID=3345810 RepID=UPI0035DB7B92
MNIGGEEHAVRLGIWLTDTKSRRAKLDQARLAADGRRENDVAVRHSCQHQRVMACQCELPGRWSCTTDKQQTKSQ